MIKYPYALSTFSRTGFRKDPSVIHSARKGQGLVEYAIIPRAVAIVVIAILRLMDPLLATCSVQIALSTLSRERYWKGGFLVASLFFVYQMPIADFRREKDAKKPASIITSCKCSP
jgi:hypothetical protein